MTGSPRTLLIGATGMLGRPVARRLRAEGVPLRALVRDPGRARGVLPGGCELAPGDALDGESLAAAMDGIDAVYINLAAPRSPRRRDVELEAVPLIVETARRAGVRHLLKISFMGVPEASDLWWQVRHKAESERVIRESGLDHTILLPTWFMESIPLFRMGRRLVVPRLPDDPVWWIAGDDYARQVAAALRVPAARNRSYVVQGPEPLSFAEAARRFARAAGETVARMPMWVVRGLAPVSADARYLRDLLAVTLGTNTVFRGGDAWEDLARPSMTIEDYAQYMRRTGDVPRK